MSLSALGFTLHHVGYAVPAIEPIQRLYVSRYGYQILTPIIHDQFQTAHVQFLRLPGDAIYLELVSPDGPPSKLTRAAKAPGVIHHLCYAVSDIEVATRTLHQSGMIILTMPIPAIAFGGRRISWLIGEDKLPVELVERGAAGEI